MIQPAKVLLVTLRFRGSVTALEEDAARIANPIAQVPGLVWKLWMINPDSRTAGGVYLFETQEALGRFVDGPIAARINNRPDVDEVVMRVFDVMDAPSRKTRALLPPDAGGAGLFPMI